MVGAREGGADVAAVLGGVGVGCARGVEGAEGGESSTGVDDGFFGRVVEGLISVPHVNISAPK